MLSTLQVVVFRGAGAVVLLQKKSQPSSLNAAELALQGKQDKGAACVMAILDDVVTGLLACPACAPGGADAADEPEDNA